MASALLRPAFPFRSMREFLCDLARMVRRAGPIPDVGVIAYCDDGRSLVALPEEVATMGARGQCASCVLLALYGATLAYQNGRLVDLCCSALGADVEHAWYRVDGMRRDPSVEGGARIPPMVYVGAVIVSVN